MTVALATARKWTCDRCGVAVSRMHGERVPLPDTWIDSAEGCYCLGCRRERAADAALEEATECDRGDRAKLRRATLIQFEVQRVPDRSNNVIAKACRTTPAAVAAVRRRLDPVEGQ
jgi:hypothetical protein